MRWNSGHTHEKHCEISISSNLRNESEWVENVCQRAARFESHESFSSGGGLFTLAQVHQWYIHSLSSHSMRGIRPETLSVILSPICSSCRQYLALMDRAPEKQKVPFLRIHCHPSQIYIQTLLHFSYFFSELMISHCMKSFYAMTFVVTDIMRNHISLHKLITYIIWR